MGKDAYSDEFAEMIADYSDMDALAFDRAHKSANEEIIRVNGRSIPLDVLQWFDREDISVIRIASSTNVMVEMRHFK